MYFGALTALNENVLTENDLREGKVLLPVGLEDDRHDPELKMDDDQEDRTIQMDAITKGIPAGGKKSSRLLLKSVAGASSGAMVSVLLAAGMDPRDSADFASTMTVNRFWDFPGFGGAIKGDLFEEIMVNC